MTQVTRDPGMAVVAPHMSRESRRTGVRGESPQLSETWWSNRPPELLSPLALIPFPPVRAMPALPYPMGLGPHPKSFIDLPQAAHPSNPVVRPY